MDDDTLFMVALVGIAAYFISEAATNVDKTAQTLSLSNWLIDPAAHPTWCSWFPSTCRAPGQAAAGGGGAPSVDPTTLPSWYHGTPTGCWPSSVVRLGDGTVAPIPPGASYCSWIDAATNWIYPRSTDQASIPPNPGSGVFQPGGAEQSPVGGATGSW